MTGYQAPRCACGHAAGEHRTVSSHTLHVQHGICLVPGCWCREFHEVKAGERAA